MFFEPLGNRVLVQTLEKKEEVRTSGLIIPESAKEKPQEALVIAAGPGRLTEEGRLLPMHLKVGDKILYGKYSGTEIKIANESYLIMHEDDVLGRIAE